MSQTESITTEHGRIEYETVDCDSCGAEVAKKDAYRYIMYERGADPEYVGGGNKRAIGWACEYCFDSGPLDVPDTNPRTHAVGWLLWATFSDYPADAVIKILSVAFGVFMILGALDASGVL